ncbi:MAG: hypothetical protein E6I36_15790 [Chloroflexi bacterium]|nr:MAG: hypothetical protein E6I36_15790 [Chloroflexota bacterium]
MPRSGQTITRWATSSPTSSTATASAAATSPESRAGRDRVASRAVRLSAKKTRKPAATKARPTGKLNRKPSKNSPLATAARIATRIGTISGRGTSAITSSAAIRAM